MKPHRNMRLHIAAFAAILTVMSGPAFAADPPEEPVMQKVLGIGGLFFRAEDPAALAKWYEQHLGISPAPTSLEQRPWQQEAGPTVFAPFEKGTDYFGKPDKAWMINLRVADLEAMVAQLRAAGITVEATQEYPYGKFARLYDPEGNPIELWQQLEPE